MSTSVAPTPLTKESATASPFPSRTHSFLKGAGAGYLYQAIALLTGLWLTPFLLHRLGQQDYGLWLAGAQILGYMMLLDLGVISLLPRETAYVMGRTARGDRAAETERGACSRSRYRPAAAFFSAWSMRVCQPRPSALKRSTTSEVRRSETATLVGCFCRPRVRRLFASVGNALAKGFAG